MALTTFRKSRPSLPHLDQSQEPFDVSNVDSIEDEIRTLVPTIHRDEFAPPAVREQLADPVEIARVTGEAITTLHETAAKTLTLLGEEMMEQIKRLEALKLDAEAGLKDVLETAEHYRERGRKHAEQITAATKLTIEIRKTCDDFRERLKE